MRDGPGFDFKIARLRAARTQRGIAVQAGIAPSVLSEFECGYRDLPPDILARLYRALRARKDDPPGEVSACHAR